MINTTTPVYLKADNKMEWPKDKFFYLLSRDGLFLCRNHQWFRSCVKAKSGPSELAEQKEFITHDYPLIPRMLLERAVGFFHLVLKEKDWESALILCWNRQTQAMELVCPDQKCSYGSVNYDIPKLPAHLALIGDLHSHCDFSPHASYTDETDEMHRPGLHIVAGYLKQEPPQFYAVIVADGERFEITDPRCLFEGYHQRDTASVPEEWLGKVKKKEWASSGYTGYYGGYGGGYSDIGGGTSYMGGGAYPHPALSKEDKEAIKRELAKLAQREECPDVSEIRMVLFRETKQVTYRYCEEKANKFIAAWPKMKGHHEKLIAKE